MIASSRHRFAFLTWLTASYLLFNFFCRLLLMSMSWARAGFSIPDIIFAFSFGLLFDIASLAFLLPFFVLWLSVIPLSWRDNKFWLGAVFVVKFAVACFLAVQVLCEGAFWMEFESRFNFIAVDYLVYTKEMLGNIWQSYRVVPLFSVCGVAALVWVLLSRFIFPIKLWAERLPERRRWVMVTSLLLCTLVSFAITDDMRQQRKNQYVNELAGNGLFSLFAAFRDNQLDYQRFYRTIPLQEAAAIVRAQITTPDAVFLSNDIYDMRRKISHSGEEQRLNVVLITVESLSSKYLGSLGNAENLTPELDKLASEGMFFTNLYATGNRTVRGLEGLSLAVPPTPGESIIRRPDNDKLFTLGTVFQNKGYQTYFIYGGYGTFDNMNSYFSGNGYRIIDRRSLKKDQITVEDIWGVADEDLFNMALREFNGESESGKPFFAHLMTTSNHRPYIFPEGRIDMPQGTRNAAVKYSDWAIGNFIKQSQETAWGKNTIFIIVADHCASSAGKTELPLAGYQIPMIIWSPGHARPQTIDRLMSQIDVAPTLLGLMNFSYESQFLGQDIFATEKGPERIFIATYQAMGYVTHGWLTVLNPKKAPEAMSVSDDQGSDKNPEESSKQAVAWYEYASAAYSRGWMKADRTRYK